MGLLETSLFLGVVSGLLYALSGAGLVLIYRTSGVVSFAQGDIAAVGLFVAFAVYSTGAPYALVALVAVVAAAVAGLMVGSAAVIPFERRGTLVAGLATIAVGILIQGSENATVGNAPRAFPSVSDAAGFHLHEVQIRVEQVVQVLVTAAIFVAMGAVIRYCRLGMALRAVNEDAEAAAMLGIAAIRLKRLSWAGAGALAGVAGLFIVPLYTLTPSSVNAVILFGFCAVIVGGINSMGGALLGGLLVGVSSNLVAAYWSPNFVTTALYLSLLLVLLVRPHGLLGRAPVRRY